MYTINKNRIKDRLCIFFDFMEKKCSCLIGPDNENRVGKTEKEKKKN